MINELRKRLEDESEVDFKEFSKNLNPGIDNLLGIRLPKLREIAKEIYQTQDWKNFLKQSDYKYYEEKMIQSMVIGVIKDKPEAILKHVKEFIPKIDGWGVCDTFCCGLKFANKNKKMVWDFVQPYLKSDKEFEIRFGVVMALGYFVDEEHIGQILTDFDKISHEGYYAKMGVAWALSVCYVKFPVETLAYLKKSNLDKWTYNKAIQKTCESLRVDKQTKLMLKVMKK